MLETACVVGKPMAASVGRRFSGSLHMALPDWLTLALFVVLVLVSSMHGLSASGHFPARGRRAELSSLGGASLLFGSIALVAAALIVGTIAAAMSSPWPALVLGGGAALLLAPITLQLFSDHFVDGRGALIAFAGGAIAAAVLIGLTAGLGWQRT
jgi:hypothetical protein